MSPKLKRDMPALGNKTILQILEELFGEQLNKTPSELHTFVYDNTLLMTEYLKKIRKELEHADDMLFVDYVCRHIKEHNWEDIENNYQKSKGSPRGAGWIRKEACWIKSECKYYKQRSYS